MRLHSTSVGRPPKSGPYVISVRGHGYLRADGSWGTVGGGGMRWFDTASAASAELARLKAAALLPDGVALVVNHDTGLYVR